MELGRTFAPKISASVSTGRVVWLGLPLSLHSTCLILTENINWLFFIFSFKPQYRMGCYSAVIVFSQTIYCFALCSAGKTGFRTNSCSLPCFDVTLLLHPNQKDSQTCTKIVIIISVSHQELILQSEVPHFIVWERLIFSSSLTFPESFL